MWYYQINSEEDFLKNIFVRVYLIKSAKPRLTKALR